MICTVAGADSFDHAWVAAARAAGGGSKLSPAAASASDGGIAIVGIVTPAEAGAVSSACAGVSLAAPTAVACGGVAAPAAHGQLDRAVRLGSIGRIHAKTPIN